VYGQSDFLARAVGTLDNPEGLAVDPRTGGLYVGDYLHNRVLYYPSGSATSSATYSAYAAESSPDTSKNLNLPDAVAADSHGSVYVADNGNKQVVCYPDNNAQGYTGTGSVSPVVYGNFGGNNTPPTGVAVDSSGGLYVAAWDVYYFPYNSSTGCASMTSTVDYAHHAVGNGSSSLGYYGVATDASNGLYAVDAGNSRVLYFPPSSSPSTQPAAQTTASKVFGQADMSTGDAHVPGIDGAGLYQPTGASVDTSGGLYVVDGSQENRVLYFTSPSTTAAAAVFGQPDLTTLTSYFGPSGFNAPGGAVADGKGGLYVADSGNHRVLWFPRQS
jgi:sugar lactone lactonase YvrE